MTRINHPGINVDFISDVVVKAQTGDRKAMEEIVVLMEPFLLRALKPYELMREDKDEILQELRIAIIKAVPEFDGTRASFQTWFSYRIQGVLRRIFFDFSGGRLSEKCVIDGRRVKRFLNARRSETGKYEIDDGELKYIREIIVGADVTREEVISLLADCSIKTVIESELNKGDILEEYAQDVFSDPEVALMTQEMNYFAMSLLENPKLTKKRAEALKLRYASRKYDTPNSAVVCKWIGTSRQNVDLLEKGGLKVLRRSVEAKRIQLDEYLD